MIADTVVVVIHGAPTWAIAFTSGVVPVCLILVAMAAAKYLGRR